MTPGVTSEEIHRRAANYRAKWSTLTFTATGLATHWSKFEDTSPAQRLADLETRFKTHPGNIGRFNYTSDGPQPTEAEIADARTVKAEIDQLKNINRK